MITSKDNETVKHISHLLKSVSYRRSCSQFAAEGVRLCTDGVRSGFTPQIFVYTSSAKEKYPEEFDELSKRALRVCEVSREIFQKISDTKSPQGFICLYNILDKRSFPNRIYRGGSYLALECVQDPSNMGTILRTAEALGIEGVILSHDCCDIYSPKVVRGSMGAVYRVPFEIEEDFPAAIEQLTKSGVPTYASTPRDAKDVTQINFSGGVMLIGNEGNGLTEKSINACSVRVRIPMRGRAESLNAAAAAAVLMWEMLR
ncbi:MAG: RNA methyltransferase [Clostridia bacterium]|nr:RNA methyltransferase [Clostridia bacterium]